MVRSGSCRFYSVVEVFIGLITAHSCYVCGVDYGDSFRVLMLSVVFFCMDFFMLFEILRTFERFLANLKVR
jgi:hypothetical protein